MAVNKGIAGLLLLLGSVAQANEADDTIRRLAAKAREYAIARSSEEVAKTLFEIAEVLPGASAEGVAAVNELSKYLAGPAAVAPRQNAALPAAPLPAAPPPQPAESFPAQPSIPQVGEFAAGNQQRAPTPASPMVAPTATVASQVSPALLELLRQKGAAALGHGDISGARRFYQRGAEAGCAPCAEAMAGTYDAEQLSRMGAIGIRPDPVQAEAWRARARQLARISIP